MARSLGFLFWGGGDCFYFSAFLKRHARKNKNQTKHPPPKKKKTPFPGAFSGVPNKISTFYQLSYFLPPAPSIIFSLEFIIILLTMHFTYIVLIFNCLIYYLSSYLAYELLKGRGFWLFSLLCGPYLDKYLVHNRHSTDNCQISEWLNGEDSGPLDPSYLVNWLRVTRVNNFLPPSIMFQAKVFCVQYWSWLVTNMSSGLPRSLGPSPRSSFYLIPSWATELNWTELNP